MEVSDYDFIQRLITKYYKTSSIQFADSVRDYAVLLTEKRSDPDKETKEAIERFDKAFALFNKDYIALGLFAEEHAEEHHTACGTATYTPYFSDIEVTDKDNAEEEVGEQLYGCSVSTETGDADAGGYDDLQIDRIETEISLTSYEEILKEYGTTKEELKEKTETA